MTVPRFLIACLFFLPTPHSRAEDNSCVNHTGIVRFMASADYGSESLPLDPKGKIWMGNPEAIPKAYFKAMGSENSCYYRFFKAIKSMSDSKVICEKLRYFERKHKIKLEFIYKSVVTFVNERKPPSSFTHSSFIAQLMPYTEKGSRVNDVNSTEVYNNSKELLDTLKWPILNYHSKSGKPFQDCSDMHELTPQRIEQSLLELEPRIIAAQKEDDEINRCKKPDSPIQKFLKLFDL
jgi:hypothetical protein